MTEELIATLCDYAQGNLRALMNMAGELLPVAAQRGPARSTRSGSWRRQGRCSTAAMTALPVASAHSRSDAGSSPRCGPNRRSLELVNAKTPWRSK
jgi:hypothetical protein